LVNAEYQKRVDLFECDAEGNAISRYEGSRLSIKDNLVSAQRRKATKKILDRQLRRRSNPRDERFVLAVYSPKTTYLEGLSQNGVCRLVYLATFLTYDGGLAYNNGIPILKKDLAKVLMVNYAAAREFWKEASAVGALSEKAGQIYISQKYFIKGDLRDKNGEFRLCKGDCAIRLYSIAVQEAYKASLPREVRSLSYVFRMIPYMNTEHNILCHTSETPFMEYDDRMTFPQFCVLMGYDKTHSSRLQKQLTSLTFQAGDQTQYAVIADEASEYIVVNPRLVYAGNNHIDAWEKFDETILGGGGDPFT